MGEVRALSKAYHVIATANDQGHHPEVTEVAPKVYLISEAEPGCNSEQASLPPQHIACTMISQNDSGFFASCFPISWSSFSARTPFTVHICHAAKKKRKASSHDAPIRSAGKVRY